MREIWITAVTVALTGPDGAQDCGRATETAEAAPREVNLGAGQPAT